MNKNVETSKTFGTHVPFRQQTCAVLLKNILEKNNYDHRMSLRGPFLISNSCGCQPKNRGKTPQIIHFNRVFHYFHHPFWGENTPIFGSTPMLPIDRFKVPSHLEVPFGSCPSSTRRHTTYVWLAQKMEASQNSKRAPVQ